MDLIQWNVIRDKILIILLLMRCDVWGWCIMLSVIVRKNQEEKTKKKKTKTKNPCF